MDEWDGWKWMNGWVEVDEWMGEMDEKCGKCRRDG